MAVQDLQSIVIPNSVTSTIGQQAFRNCTSLSSVIIGENVTGIESAAFNGCKSLTSITISDNVTKISGWAFNGCSALKKAEIGSGVTSIERNAFQGCIKLEEIIIPDAVTKIEEAAFGGCSALKKAQLGNGVTSIGEGAFSGCKNLEEIIIPDNVTSIGKNAFNSCSALKKAQIGNKLVTIPAAAFGGCKNLEEIIIPDNVTSIGESAFSGCSALKKVQIGNGVTSIGDYAFNECTLISDVTLGNKVASLGNRAFNGCKNITSLVIPKSVTNIGTSALNGVSENLKSIVVEEGNRKYDSRDSCNAIINTLSNALVLGCQNTIIPETIETIESSAFYNCKGLKSITIPESVTSIGQSFSGCDSLVSVVMKSVTPAELSQYTFSSYYSKVILYVPIGSLENYKSATYWKNFKNIAEYDVTGIEDVTEDDVPAFEVTTGGIQLTAAEGKAVAVYSVGGALIKKVSSYAGEEITLDKGVYILRVGDKAVRDYP